MYGAMAIHEIMHETKRRKEIVYKSILKKHTISGLELPIRMLENEGFQ
jgi:hypothetical protein